MFSIVQAAGWPIWLLIVCSVVGLSLVIERFLSLRKKNVAPTRLLEEAITIARNKLPPQNVVEQLYENSALGEVLATGLRALHDNPKASEEDLRFVMEAVGRRVTERLEKYLNALATLASAAPLLGLLGTVIGMIEIFGSQGTSGTSHNPLMLAHGISVALYNTAFGLMVAIPALIFWRYFRSKVDAYLLTLELAAERFLRHLVVLKTRL